jgi:hypothetical protein
MAKNLEVKIRETKNLGAGRVELTQSHGLDMIARFNCGRKVRCHKTGVEKFGRNNSV